VNVLLDTHAFLWFSADDPKLSPRARFTIEDSSNQVYLSLGSVWEMAIKISLGKLSLRRSLTSLVMEALERRGISLLGIQLSHAAKVAELPFHHRDPFDRLLVAQCLVLDMPLVSCDLAADPYGVKRIW
jgi:PIN domain nuclease of toxin-antitoxin system